MADRTTYRSDTLRALTAQIPRAYRNCPAYLAVCNFDVGEFGDFPVPPGLAPGPYSACRSDELDEALLDGMAAAPSVAAGKTLAQFRGAYFGLHAVLRLAHHARSHAPPGLDCPADEASLRDALFLFGGDSAQHSAQDLRARLPVFRQLARRYWNPANQAVRTLIRAVAAEGTRYRRAARHEAWQDEGLLEGGRPISEGALQGFTALSMGRLTLLWKGDAEFTHAYILGRTQIDQFRDIILGAANAEVAAGLRLSGSLQADRALLAATTNELDWLFRRGSELAPKDAPLLAGACDTAHFAFLASIASELDSRPKEKLELKYREKCFTRVASLDSIVARWRSSVIPEADRLELSYLHRLIPAGDYDQFGAAYRQSTQIFNAEDFVKPPFEGQHWQGIQLSHRQLMLSAFYDVHGKCPGHIIGGAQRADPSWVHRYPHCMPGEIPLVGLRRIDFAGEFLYKARGSDCMDLVKDAGMCVTRPETVRCQKDRLERPARDKNKLLNYLLNSATLDTTVLDWDELDHTVELDDKAERKKIDQRGFYKTGLHASLKLSELEDSIGTYAKHAPGVINGLNQADRHRELESIHQLAPVYGPNTAVTWSFDIAGFSRYLSVDVHLMLQRHWAEAFGRPDILKSHYTLTRGVMKYVKAGVCHEYAKTGIDFEGLYGKRNTMYHAAVMNYVVYRLRQDRVIKTIGRFGCFIDDGLLRIEVAKENLRAVVRRISDVIEEIYAAGSMRLSWDKTLVSQVGSTFLGDVCLHSKVVPCSLKAALGVSAENDDAIRSLGGDLDALQASVSGALSTGTGVVAACALQALHAVSAIARYKSEGSCLTVSTAVWAFVPRSMGGLGMRGTLGLCASVAAQLLVESVATLAAIARRNAGTVSLINAILNETLVKARLSDEARNQGVQTVQVRRPTLSGDRLLRKLAVAVAEQVQQPQLVQLVHRADDPRCSFVALQLEMGAVLPLVLRKRLAETEPSALCMQIAGKFLHTAAVEALIGYKARRRAEEAYKSEARRVLEGYRF